MHHLLNVMKEVAPHEPGHLMGLVSVIYLDGDPTQAFGTDISHNRWEFVDNNGTRSLVHYIMNGGLSADLAMDGIHRPFKAKNAEYLEFILPKPQP